VRASYWWIVTSTLFVGFLAGTSTSARATGIHERIPMRMREATMVLAGDSSRGRLTKLTVRSRWSALRTVH
jgi:hypothetical protein